MKFRISWTPLVSEIVCSTLSNGKDIQIQTISGNPLQISLYMVSSKNSTTEIPTKLGPSHHHQIHIVSFVLPLRQLLWELRFSFSWFVFDFPTFCPWFISTLSLFSVFAYILKYFPSQLLVVSQFSIVNAKITVSGSSVDFALKRRVLSWVISIWTRFTSTRVHFWFFSNQRPFTLVPFFPCTLVPSAKHTAAIVPSFPRIPLNHQ